MNSPDSPTSSLGERQNRSEWLRLLQKHNKTLLGTPLAELLDQPRRFEQFSRRAGSLLLDYSRVHIDELAMAELLSLAEKLDVAGARNKLFSGEAVNSTERRPAMHMALRCPELLECVPPEDATRVRETGARMRTMAACLHRGRLPADHDVRVTDIVHIGIGGSLLGPRLVCEALPPGGPDAPHVHFLGSVDAYQREQLLPRLNAERTVVVLASKSFSTPDTLIHGRRVLDWLEQALGEEQAALRVFAVTAATERAEAFGAPSDQVLFLPEWVGGRYSLWSAVGLAAAAQSGPEAFDSLLAGAAGMDRHFREAELADNLPVLLALLGVWHRNVCGYPAWGVIPYDQRLRLLPAHLQQLIMESNGKATALDGHAVGMGTAPLVFGECGTDAQHSLFQSMHQGTDTVPLHFVGVVRPDHRDQEAHAELVANMLAQATALATGRSVAETRQLLNANAPEDEALIAQRSFDGNRPSEVLVLDQLDAVALGAMLAMYEHAVFVQSVIWNINAFDQWGVELGKTLAPGIRRNLSGEESTGGVLAGLVALFRKGL